MIESYGAINQEGKFIPSNKLELADEMMEWVGEPVKMTLVKADNTISGAQRRYFFGAVVNSFHRWFNEHGNQCSKQNVVEFIKDKWMHRETFNPLTNSITKTYISLSNSEGALSKDEFSKYKEEIQAYAATTLDLIIEDPKEKMWK